MSSLKGQLANVEGSVKSMKMAVVVGSVLTVACLAAVFGVTILANEVSKETKVSNGALVQRNGDNVVVSSKTSGSLKAALLAGKMHAGDVIKTPFAENSNDFIECTVESVATVGDISVASCADVAFWATESDEGVTVVYGDESFMNSLGYEKMTEESRKTQWIGVACSIGSIALGGYNCWANREECLGSQAKSAASTIASGIASTAGKRIAGALTGASCVGLAYGLWDTFG